MTDYNYFTFSSRVHDLLFKDVSVSSSEGKVELNELILFIFIIYHLFKNSTKLSEQFLAVDIAKI